MGSTRALARACWATHRRNPLETNVCCGLVAHTCSGARLIQKNKNKRKPVYIHLVRSLYTYSSRSKLWVKYSNKMIDLYSVQDQIKYNAEFREVNAECEVARGN